MVPLAEAEEEDSVTVSEPDCHDESFANTFRLDEVTLTAKITSLTNKKKNGEKLTDKENQELARLNRVKASRKYRQREKEEK